MSDITVSPLRPITPLEVCQKPDRRWVGRIEDHRIKAESWTDQATFEIPVGSAPCVIELLRSLYAEAQNGGF